MQKICAKKRNHFGIGFHLSAPKLRKPLQLRLLLLPETSCNFLRPQDAPFIRDRNC